MPGTCWELERDERAHAGQAEEEPAHTAQAREHEPLGQHLADETTLPRAERGPDGQLAIAPGSTHQQEVGDVRARDEQHEQDEDLEEIERCAEIADELVADRHGVAAEAARARERLPLGQAFQHAIDDRLHLRVDLLDRRARLEAGDHLAELVAATLVRHLLGRERERHEQRDVTSRELEVGGQDAHDLIRLAAQTDAAPDDRTIGREAGVPQVVGQDDELVRPRLCLHLGERAAQERLALKGAEERRGHRQATHLHGLAFGRHAQAAHREQGRILERGCLRLAIDVVGNGDAGLG